MIDREALIDRLSSWAAGMEQWWRPIDGGGGWFGTGFDAWGVQTQQKYFSAMATLAAHTVGAESDRYLVRAESALRANLDSHVSGQQTCADGRQWGHTWISPLGIERMMFAVQELGDRLDPQLQSSLRRVLTSEADWMTDHYEKGDARGVVADLWDRSGRNLPESNLWTGALLWRAAQAMPDHPRSRDWATRSIEFLANGVSLETDADDERLLDGVPLSSLHRGANLFPNFALDHHGYLNIGYLVICVSNAAILYLDLLRSGQSVPEMLHLHQAELWKTLRRFILPDGRLARIGGDSRIRYAYCQDYLMPALLYAHRHLGDDDAPDLLERQLHLARREQAADGDRSFFGTRLEGLRAKSPYYYLRIETDRANTIAMVAAHIDDVAQTNAQRLPFARSTATGGGWSEPRHGGVMHRSDSRLASFSWRAHGQSTALCFPPDRSDLAEWDLNLVSEIRMLGDDRRSAPSRRLAGFQITEFDGGFATSGRITEGAELRLDEGWSGHDAAVSTTAVAALPDGRTMLGLQTVRMGPNGGYTRSIKGLHLNVPNDLFNDFTRTVSTDSGVRVLRSPAARDDVIAVGRHWLNVDERVGVIGVYGSDRLVIDRTARRRGGPQRSLHVDEICWSHDTETRRWESGELVLDIGWAALSDATSAETAVQADPLRTRRVDAGHDDLRALLARAADGRDYLLVVNTGDDVHDVALDQIAGGPVQVLEPTATSEPASRPGGISRLAPYQHVLAVAADQG